MSFVIRHSSFVIRHSSFVIRQKGMGNRQKYALEGCQESMYPISLLF
ncbi:hypothetical protein [Coleofasciculus sp. F4-SAH-05]